MRICSSCGSIMKIRLAKKGQFKENYFWGCSKYPDCNYSESTIVNRIPEDYYRSHLSHNSMKLKNPYDTISDAERHLAIKEHFAYNHQFNKEDLITLDFILGFEEKLDFYFWTACQTRVVNLGVHNYFPVGSPYYFTFTALVKAINKDFENVIEEVFIKQNDLINSSVEFWLSLFEAERAQREAKSKFNADKEQQRHMDAVKRKANEANSKIFNAIRRKDIKAIIALRKSGADLNYKNEDGLNCFEYAKTINDDKVMEALTLEIQL